MPVNILFRLQRCLSWFGLIAGLFAVLVVLGSYLVSAQQVYRGPSLFYFYTFLLLAIWSRKWSTFLLILMLPLLPNLATQAEFILHPRVKYFIAYPGVDAVVGLFAGQLVRTIYKKEDLRQWLVLPPWPVGLTIFVITVSTGITISRNLWLGASVFYVPGFLNNLFRFKHMGVGNDYLVLADLIVYCAATLLIICLLTTLKASRQKDDAVFTPVVIGLMLSAAWGIFQAMTGFGLPVYALQYRTDSIGHSAFGFEPDIHAFAGHMLIGAIGLFGYLFSTQRAQAKYWGRIILAACLSSWVALMLSKSRATFIFAILFTVFVIFNALLRQENQQIKRRIAVVSLVGVAMVAVLGLTGHLWFNVIIDEVIALKQINFQTLNRLSVYRLELFSTAINMFEAFPLMGVGQGNFLHLSSVPAYISSAGGENAHNYFLQTAAELGLAGVVGFVLIFALPWFTSKDRRALSAATFAIAAIFIGNIYSHPLIIRENLLFLAVFVALLYAHSRSTQPTEYVALRPRSNQLAATMVLLSASCFCYFAWVEVAQSFTSDPFLKGAECFKETDKTEDGWMRGSLTIQLPQSATGLSLLIDKSQPHVLDLPLSATLTLMDSDGHVVATTTYSALRDNDFSLSIALPEAQRSALAVADRVQPWHARVQLSRCFTESNFAQSDNPTRKGLHIKSVRFH